MNNLNHEMYKQKSKLFYYKLDDKFGWTRTALQSSFMALAPFHWQHKIIDTNEIYTQKTRLIISDSSLEKGGTLKR